MLKVNKVEVSDIRFERKAGVNARKSRIYIWPEGETLLQNLENRRNRPVGEWKRKVIPEILRQAGLPADTKVSFSQKCGCRCGCSPGFYIKDHWGKKISASISEE